MPSLADKYRPDKLDDVLGHAETIATLRRFESRGELTGRAYWISGATGIGIDNSHSHCTMCECQKKERLSHRSNVCAKRAVANTAFTDPSEGRTDSARGPAFNGRSLPPNTLPLACIRLASFAGPRSSSRHTVSTRPSTARSNAAIQRRPDTISRYEEMPCVAQASAPNTSSSAIATCTGLSWRKSSAARYCRARSSTTLTEILATMTPLTSCSPIDLNTRGFTTARTANAPLRAAAGSTPPKGFATCTGGGSTNASGSRIGPFVTFSGR